MGLKLWHRDHLQWHELLTVFYENLRVGSKVFFWGGGGVGRHTIDMISHLLFFKENNLHMGS
jgi:hypothetical protein